MIGLAFGALSTLGTIGQFAGNLMGSSARQSQMRQGIRALEMEKRKTVGVTAARSGASGVEGSSASTLDYLRGLGAEFDLAIAAQKKALNITRVTDLIGAGSGLLGGLTGTARELNALNPRKSDSGWY